MIGGRGLTAADTAGAPLALLVNETALRSGLLGADPLGKRVYAAGPEPWEIVGVVEDIRQFGLDREPGLQVFVDYRQLPSRSLNGLYLAVRTDGMRSPVTTDLRRLVRELDPQATLDPVATMGQLLANTLSRPRLYAALLGTFGAVTASLAAIGLYGLVAYSVAQRTREIGVRVALGAGHARILALPAVPERAGRASVARGVYRLSGGSRSGPQRTGPVPGRTARSARRVLPRQDSMPCTPTRVGVYVEAQGV